jgi:hypothetical protein
MLGFRLRVGLIVFDTDPHKRFVVVVAALKDGDHHLIFVNAQLL